MIDYTYRPDVDDFQYVYAPLTDTFETPSQVSAAIKRASDQFGIKFKIARLLGTVSKIVSDKILYVLIGPVNVGPNSHDVRTIATQIDKINKARKDVRINLLTTFDLKRGLSKNFDPPLFDGQHRCNTIYPDEIVDGMAQVSSQDIYDNIICETIRLKYKAWKDPNLTNSRRLVMAQKTYTTTINDLSELFADYHLWHRAPADGAIYFPTPYGMLVSQTKTNKTKMNPSNFSLVTGYNTDQNKVQFSGEKIPSSDTPEYLRLIEHMAASNLKLPGMIVHFHHPVLTRADKFSYLVTPEELEYGIFQSGDGIFSHIQSVKSSWIILKNHGILWMGHDNKAFSKFLEVVIQPR